MNARRVLFAVLSLSLGVTGCQAVAGIASTVQDVECVKDSDCGAGQQCSPNTMSCVTAGSALLGHPFPNHTKYVAGIKPAQPQKTLDGAVKNYYDVWKQKYFKPSTCDDRGYVVPTHPDEFSSELTTSEAHGYGMLIAALMAGYDPHAQDIFDGLYRFFLRNASHATPAKDTATPTVMCWQESTMNCDHLDNSRTDADVDIAYALLLADRQWGSAAGINYVGAAQALIEQIQAHDIVPARHLPALGDWANDFDDPVDCDPSCLTTMRPHYMLIDHYRSLAAAADAVPSPDAQDVWASMVDASYALLARYQKTHQPGLWPFELKIDVDPPVPSMDTTDGDKFDNQAAGLLWRLGVDYVVSGDKRAKATLDPINTWIVNITQGNLFSIADRYQLDGTPLPVNSRLSYSTEGPFGVAAMVDASNQTWLDGIWEQMTGHPILDDVTGFRGDTMKLLTMIVMSGNWWAP